MKLITYYNIVRRLNVLTFLFIIILSGATLGFFHFEKINDTRIFETALAVISFLPIPALLIHFFTRHKINAIIHKAYQNTNLPIGISKNVLFSDDIELKDYYKRVRKEADEHSYLSRTEKTPRSSENIPLVRIDPNNEEKEDRLSIEKNQDEISLKNKKQIAKAVQNEKREGKIGIPDLEEIEEEEEEGEEEDGNENTSLKTIYQKQDDISINIHSMELDFNKDSVSPRLLSTAIGNVKKYIGKISAKEKNNDDRKTIQNNRAFIETNNELSDIEKDRKHSKNSLEEYTKGYDDGQIAGRKFILTEVYEQLNRIQNATKNNILEYSGFAKDQDVDLGIVVKVFKELRLTINLLSAKMRESSRDDNKALSFKLKPMFSTPTSTSSTSTSTSTSTSFRLYKIN